MVSVSVNNIWRKFGYTSETQGVFEMSVWAGKALDRAIESLVCCAIKRLDYLAYMKQQKEHKTFIQYTGWWKLHIPLKTVLLLLKV